MSTPNDNWIKELKPVRFGTLSDHVYEAIKELILSGKIRAGEHLVEQSLADQLGVSRISVREAIRKLAKDSLVQIIPNRGAFVIQFTAADIAEIYSLRAAIEGMAIERITNLKSSKDIETLKAFIPKMVELENKEDRLQGASIDTQFHRTLMNLSKHQRATQIWELMSDQITMVMFTVSNYYLTFEGFSDRHKKMIRLIESGDAEKASNYLKSHILEGGKSLIDAMQPGKNNKENKSS